jgi:hypothetical protein
MYNIWKHCGAQVIYTLSVYFLMARQWSILLIILLIVRFFYGGFQGLADMYSRHISFFYIYFILLHSGLGSSYLTI